MKDKLFTCEDLEKAFNDGASYGNHESVINDFDFSKNPGMSPFDVWNGIRLLKKHKDEN